MLVLILIESTDLVFAVDSIPAIYAVTDDPFIVFTSNIFAILGLRSLYFVLAGYLLVAFVTLRAFDFNPSGPIRIGDLLPAQRFWSDTTVVQPGVGYDGQWFFNIAHDPFLRSPDPEAFLPFDGAGCAGWEGWKGEGECGKGAGAKKPRSTRERSCGAGTEKRP